MNNPFSLENKTILVTGASSGIGRSIAKECSNMNARLIITARDKKRLQETMDMMGGDGHKYICSDLTDEVSIRELVKQLPNIDGIVHNAGICILSTCKTVEHADIRTLMQTNFIGMALLQKYILSEKKLNKNASIVFIASRAPFAPAIGKSFYAASKGAVLGYAKGLGLELAPRLIRVNCICPAMVWTDLIASEAETIGADYKQEQLKYPLKRYGRPEDIAYLTIYLLSDASSWMTGSCIDITGGGENTLV